MEQVERDARSSNPELAGAAQCVMAVSGWGHERTIPSREWRERKKHVRDAFRAGAKSVYFNSDGSSGVFYGTGNEQLDGEIMNWRQGGGCSPMPYGTPIEIQEDVERERANKQSREEASFWADVYYNKARKNAGLSYNRELESLFDGPVKPECSPMVKQKTPPPVLRDRFKQGPDDYIAEILPPNKTQGTQGVIRTNMSAKNEVTGKGMFGNISIFVRDASKSPILVVSCIEGYRAGAFSLYSFIFDLKTRRMLSWDGTRTIAGEQWTSPVGEHNMNPLPSAERYSRNQTDIPDTKFEAGKGLFPLFPHEISFYRMELWRDGAILAVKESPINGGTKPANLPKDWFVPSHNTFFSNVFLHAPENALGWL